MIRETQFVTTEDGSFSRFDQETGELFHNRAGAITEAFKNYVEPAGAGELIRDAGSLAVLDVCFGLGYNTWMLMESLLASELLPGRVKVLGIERDGEVLADAVAVLDDSRFSRVQELLGSSTRDSVPALEFDRTYTLRSGTMTFELVVQQGDLRMIVPSLLDSFDIVYHDPFSPAKVPELWTVDLFRHYFRLLSPRRGKLLTYSAAAAVRGGLQEARFCVWRTAAVGGKTGGTLASSETTSGSPLAFALSDQEAQKLRSRSGVPYRDPSFSAPRSCILDCRRQEQNNFTQIYRAPESA